MFEITHCSYDTLKRKIYEFETNIDASRGTLGLSHERSALLGRFGHDEVSASTDEKFVPLLDRELDKIITFYKAQEHELREELDQLSISIARREEEGFNGLTDARFSDDGDSDDDDMSYGDLTMSRRMSTSRSRRKRSISGGSPVNTRRRYSGKYGFVR